MSINSKRIKKEKIHAADERELVFPLSKPLECVCAHCYKLNTNLHGPSRGWQVAFYSQNEEDTLETPGAYRMKVLCKHCGKHFYIVWDEDPT